jgi:hypothetical protein
MVNNIWKPSVYPNPVIFGSLQIKTNTRLTGIRITDINGKTIFKRSSSISTDTNYINVSGFAAGIYFIEFINDKHEIYHTRFIKE